MPRSEGRGRWLGSIVLAVVAGACAAPDGQEPRDGAAQVVAPRDETRLVRLVASGGLTDRKAYPVILTPSPTGGWSSAFRLICNDCNWALAAFGYTAAGAQFGAEYGSVEALRTDNQLDLPIHDLPLEARDPVGAVLSAFRLIDETEPAAPRYFVRLKEDPTALYAVRCENFLQVAHGGRETIPISKALLAHWRVVDSPWIGCSSEAGKLLPAPAPAHWATRSEPPAAPVAVWRVRRPHRDIATTPYPYLVVREPDGALRGFAIDCGSEVPSALRALGFAIDAVRTDVSDAELEQTAFEQQPVIACPRLGGAALTEVLSPNDPAGLRRYLFGRARDAVAFGCADAQDYWGARASARFEAPVQAVPYLSDGAGEVGQARTFALGCREGTRPGALAYVYGPQQHLFAPGPSGELLHWWWEPEPIGLGHESWGTGVAGVPTGFVYGEQQHVFARSDRGQLRHWYWSPTHDRPAQEVWGDGVASDPTSFVYHDQQHVFARGALGTLQHWYWSPGAARPAFQSWGGGFTGSPTSFVYYAQQHVFGRGTRGELWHWYWGPDDPTIQVEQWGDGLAGDPASFVAGDQQHVFARGLGGELLHRYWYPGVEGHLEEVWDSALSGDPMGFVYGDQQHVFGRSPLGELVHWYWQPGLTERRREVWGAAIVDDPTGYVFRDQQHVFARGTDGQLRRFTWAPGFGAPASEVWSAP